MTLNDSRKTIRNIGEAVEPLPENGREFILGYAEGLMARPKRNRREKEVQNDNRREGSPGGTGGD